MVHSALAATDDSSYTIKIDQEYMNQDKSRSRHERYLRRPLYHGTSSVNIEPIERTGLGNCDYNKDYNVLECFKELFKQFEDRSKIVHRREYYSWRMIYGQKIGVAGSNFRHGSLYVSASYHSAINYAKSPEGSEILNSLNSLFDFVEDIILDIRQIYRLKYPKLMERLELKGVAIVYKITNVAASCLLNEQGGPAQGHIDKMESLPYTPDVENFLDDAVLSQYNFDIKNLNSNAVVHEPKFISTCEL